jgi:SAM-dependent methyltransferase
MLRTLKSLIKNVLYRRGLELVPTGLGYLEPNDVAPKAIEKGLSLCEYLESYNIGGVGVRRDRICDVVASAIALESPRILEIGTGTGIYLERLLLDYSPAHYEIYETNVKWVTYLKDTFHSNPHVVFPVTDGRSLSPTITESVDMVTAHGVFVYLPLITTIGYLEEMYRVCRKGGYLVFDCFIDDRFGLSTVEAWRRDSHGYAFPVVLTRKILNEFVTLKELELVTEFDVDYHASQSTYFIYRK